MVDLNKLIVGEMDSARLLVEDMLKSEELIRRIGEAGTCLVECFQNGGKVLLAGNGGSAADAQHIAGEFVSRFNFDRPGLPAMALTVDSSVMTAIGNDYGYENLFTRQLQANCSKGDVFIAYSTSGSSPNILSALRYSKEVGLTTIGMTGNKCGPMNDLCDFVIESPSSHTPKIQEGHLIVGHILCMIVEETIFAEFKPK